MTVPPNQELANFSVSESHVVPKDGGTSVDFDSDVDPSDPLHWSPLYKWMLVVLISLMTMIV